MAHDDLIGREEGFTITSSAGGEYLVFRPLLSEFVVSMPRGAAVVYPKDAAQIVSMADIFPGAHVVEAGAGSGRLTCSLLRAVGPHGRVTSYERREEFADVARQNVTQFFGGEHPAWGSGSGTWPRACWSPATTPTGSSSTCWRPGTAWTRPPGPCVPAGSSARTSPPPRSSLALRRDRAPARRLHRAAALGVARARLARRGARGPPGAQDDRPHGVPRHRATDGPGQRPPLKKRRPAPGAYGPGLHRPPPARSPGRPGGMITNPLPNRDKHPHIWDRDATSRG